MTSLGLPAFSDGNGGVASADRWPVTPRRGRSPPDLPLVAIPGSRHSSPGRLRGSGLRSSDHAQWAATHSRGHSGPDRPALAGINAVYTAPGLSAAFIAIAGGYDSLTEHEARTARSTSVCVPDRSAPRRRWESRGIRSVE